MEKFIGIKQLGEYVLAEFKEEWSLDDKTIRRNRESLIDAISNYKSQNLNKDTLTQLEIALFKIEKYLSTKKNIKHIKEFSLYIP